MCWYTYLGAYVLKTTEQARSRLHSKCSTFISLSIRQGGILYHIGYRNHCIPVVFVRLCWLCWHQSSEEMKLCLPLDPVKNHSKSSFLVCICFAHIDGKIYSNQKCQFPVSVDTPCWQQSSMYISASALFFPRLVLWCLHCSYTWAHSLGNKCEGSSPRYS